MKLLFPHAHRSKLSCDQIKGKSMDARKRCGWVKNNILYQKYHYEEWGTPDILIWDEENAIG